MIAFTLAGVVAHSARAAIVFGQLDDFEGGTPMGWVEGDPSPNPPRNVATGGPQGGGDNYLRNISDTGQWAGSKMIMFNAAQWAGDYSAAGVTRVEGWMANLGQTPLSMRFIVRSGGTAYGSTTPAVLPADGAWRRVAFDLTASRMSRIDGVQSLAAVLTNVGTVRVLSSSRLQWEGDDLDGVLGVDDLRAMRLPGDADFDGRVTAADFWAVRRNLGSPAPSGQAGWRRGDFDFDGRVDAHDVIAVRRNFGRTAAAAPAEAQALATVVPEPATGAMLMCGATCLLLRRRGISARF